MMPIRLYTQDFAPSNGVVRGEAFRQYVYVTRQIFSFCIVYPALTISARGILDEHDMYIKVFVTPSAKKEKIEEKGDTLRISVREPALQNLANDHVREIIANRLGVVVGKVPILTGHRSRVKMISMSD